MNLILKVFMLLLLLIAPLTICAQTTNTANAANAANTTNKPHSTSISQILSAHQKSEPVSLKLKTGKRIEGIAKSWDRRTLTIEDPKVSSLTVIRLSAIEQIKFGLTMHMKMVEAKNSFKVLTMSSLNLFSLLTTGKLLAQ